VSKHITGHLREESFSESTALVLTSGGEPDSPQSTPRGILVPPEITRQRRRSVVGRSIDIGRPSRDDVGPVRSQAGHRRSSMASVVTQLRAHSGQHTRTQRPTQSSGSDHPRRPGARPAGSSTPGTRRWAQTAASHADAIQKPTFHDVRRYWSTSNPRRKDTTHTHTHTRGGAGISKRGCVPIFGNWNFRGKVTARCWNCHFGQNHAVVSDVLYFHPKTENRRSLHLRRKSCLWPWPLTFWPQNLISSSLSPTGPNKL